VAAHFFPTSAFIGRAPLSRDSDGRFRLRRSRANQTQNHLGTHRAFIHALPPSLGLRFVPFSVPSVFVRWRSSEEQKQAGNGRKEKTMKLEEIKSKAPFSKRFEEAVGQACESAAKESVVPGGGVEPPRY
jgi:hypothetical protein